MNYEHEVQVKTRPTSVGERQMFQTELVPNAVLSGKTLYERLAQRSGLTPTMARVYVNTIEGFILEEIAAGNRLDFELASFYPRLSKSLSARDADPVADGAFVRGAVKVRKELMNAPRKTVRPVNNMAHDLPRIAAVFDTVTQSGERIGAGHEIRIYGTNIPVDASRADEGVWLETRRRGKVASAEIVHSSASEVRCVFHDALAPVGYTLVLGTRCGRGVDFHVRRCLAKVVGTAAEGGKAAKA